MSSKFGVIGKLNFLQDMASWVISSINPPIIHNLEKYLMLHKVFYYTACENIQGDYLEFGVYTGSSFCHAIRSYMKNLRYEAEKFNTRFFGFDSFDGFGEINEIDIHPFYTKENFTTSYDKVKRRIQKASGGGVAVNLIKGFFNESLSKGPLYFGIGKARIIFIDSDTYTAAYAVLKFCHETLQIGTVIIFDDRLSYKGRLDAGEIRAFNEFLSKTGIGVIEYGRYGVCGGMVYVVNSIHPS
ncbi:MAG: class I SAM-dependent methyltransferase [Desulfovibrio sp.]|jgi:hypothetical protein|nr:class I SAM-dependent methyltransferase [Desulfovibrio sp.]